MKTLTTSILLAALVAPFAGARFEIVVSLAFAAGFLAIAALDYTRTVRPLPIACRARRASPARFVAPPLNCECNRLAA